MKTNDLKNSMFHPFEVAICGHSNSGKTTLIEKILKIASSQAYQVGVVKHDAHQFEMDKEGKDTFRFREAGAKDVFISNEFKSCLQSSGKLNSFALKQVLIDCDFVIVEGHKSSKLPKFLMADEAMLTRYKAGELENVLGIITEDFGAIPQLQQEFSLPVFYRDEAEALFEYILSLFKPAKVKALILAGGKSTRMGKDKGQLNYHGDYQTKTLARMLARYTDEIYVSVRSDQKNDEHVMGLPQVLDVFPSQGPISGILSAMNTDPQAAWLVVAVDLPYLDDETLDKLFEKRNPLKLASCFENPERKWPEPLCTIWEPKAKLKLHQFMGMDRLCPRKILFNSEINLLQLDNQHALDNCNTQEEFQKAKSFLETRQ